MQSLPLKIRTALTRTSFVFVMTSIVCLTTMPVKAGVDACCSDCGNWYQLHAHGAGFARHHKGCCGECEKKAKEQKSDETLAAAGEAGHIPYAGPWTQWFGPLGYPIDMGEHMVAGAATMAGSVIALVTTVPLLGTVETLTGQFDYQQTQDLASGLYDGFIAGWELFSGGHPSVDH